MKLILAIDSVFPPLTGIGRYAWELATRLERRSDFDDARFFSMGRWIPVLDEALTGSGPEASVPTATRTIALALRKRLSTHRWAVHVYHATMTPWLRYRLGPYRDYLYHSPNFFVPPFKGKSIATIHDLSNYKYPETHPRARRKMFDLNMESTLKRVSHLITDSEAMRREVVDFFGWPEDRVSAVHLGVSSRYKPRNHEEIAPELAEYGLCSGGYTLCVSTLEPRKRIGSLLNAYEMLPQALRWRFPLVLAGGGGWLNQPLWSRIERACDAGWLRQLGFVSDGILPVLYAGARAFCYPSVYEGFGLPVLEAMASGIPVLTSNRSSLPEVADGAAWLIDPDDIDAMRSGLQKVIEDTNWRSQAVERGLGIATGKTWEHCMDRTMDIYRAVTAAP